MPAAAAVSSALCECSYNWVLYRTVNRRNKNDQVPRDFGVAASLFGNDVEEQSESVERLSKAGEYRRIVASRCGKL